MQPSTRIVLIASATFLAGALAGAAVAAGFLSDGGQPSSAPADAADARASSAPQAPVSVAMLTAPQSAPESPAQTPTEPALEQEDSPLEAASAMLARIDELTAGWGRMQAELAELRERVARVERREPEQDDATDSVGNRSRPTTPREQRDALLRAGVTPEAAEDIIWRRSQTSLARLELRDEAARDGWLGTDRYREELRRINEQRTSIEDEIGSDAYDRYLFETGQANRVAVDSVLPGSAADDSGLLPGDIIEHYGEAKVLDFGDLRAATSSGQRDELVPVGIVRDGRRLEVWLPRGPIGIGLDATRVDPSS